MYVPERIQKVERAIAQAAGVTVKEIYGRSRLQAIVDARHAIWFVLHKQMGYTSAYLGRIYGRDHTTILSGVRSIRERAADHVVDGLRKILPEVFADVEEESKGRRIEEWNWSA